MNGGREGEDVFYIYEGEDLKRRRRKRTRWTRAKPTMMTDAE